MKTWLHKFLNEQLVGSHWILNSILDFQIPCISVLDLKMPFVHSFKHLGVHIDNRLIKCVPRFLLVNEN